jgi:hypothetical protein
MPVRACVCFLEAKQVAGVGLQGHQSSTASLSDLLCCSYELAHRSGHYNFFPGEVVDGHGDVYAPERRARRHA